MSNDLNIIWLCCACVYKSSMSVVCRSTECMVCVVPDISLFRSDWKYVRQPLQVRRIRIPDFYIHTWHTCTRPLLSITATSITRYMTVRQRFYQYVQLSRDVDVAGPGVLSSLRRCDIRNRLELYLHARAGTSFTVSEADRQFNAGAVRAQCLRWLQLQQQHARAPAASTCRTHVLIRCCLMMTTWVCRSVFVAARTRRA